MARVDTTSQFHRGKAGGHRTRGALSRRRRQLLLSSAGRGGRCARLTLLQPIRAILGMVHATLGVRARGRVGGRTDSHHSLRHGLSVDDAGKDMVNAWLFSIRRLLGRTHGPASGRAGSGPGGPQPGRTTRGSRPMPSGPPAEPGGRHGSPEETRALRGRGREGAGGLSRWRWHFGAPSERGGARGSKRAGERRRNRDQRTRRCGGEFRPG